MQFINILATLLVLAAPALAIRVSWDSVYDNKANSLDIVACSDGINGLEHLGYKTFGSLKNFPNIGGASAIPGWNSANCGTCWQLTYNGRTINVLAIDHADDGFNLSKEAMDKLTNNQAEQLGVVDATFTQVDHTQCSI
ncbi:hypothetical protein EIP91_011659 [Steccherinum ochraceum]|uniref:Uncharacterized protein n=1 Tax=Steccherinum ochraceum TaxID=92696 RepID=A0A4R0RHK7_9APHY|nr:hypothetical protein EIP91_011659 [Steccherinum ochraceum]